MNPVKGGWTSHKTNSKESDYEAQKRAAMAQAGENAYIQGVQSVMEEGPGVAVRNTRTKYGNANIMPNQIFQGETSNFQQEDNPGNQQLENLTHQTGSVTTQASSTNVPQQDPDSMETDALERRLGMMARGGQGFPGLNNRNQGV